MLRHFFELTHPPYETDQEQHNSVWVSDAFVGLPPVICPQCGGPWASSKKLRRPIPPDLAAALGLFPGVRTGISWDDFCRRRIGWARLLEMAAEDVTPGMDLGPPLGNVQGPVRDDVIHPMPGYVWVQDRVKDSIETVGLLGVQFAEVVLDQEGHPRLWEMSTTGHALRIGTTPADLIACRHCGRKKFPNPKVLNVDVDRWDGTDFFHLDSNGNMLFVTERVRDLFLHERFSNCAFHPIPKLP
jgi:hypothetical protein